MERFPGHVKLCIQPKAAKQAQITTRPTTVTGYSKFDLTCPKHIATEVLWFIHMQTWADRDWTTSLPISGEHELKSCLSQVLSQHKIKIVKLIKN